MTIPKSVIEACQSDETLITALAASPSTAPNELAEQWRKNALKRKVDKLVAKLKPSKSNDELTKEDLDQAASCGRFTERPSDLFLSLYHDALLTLEDDALVGMVTPPLLGSTGVVPLSVISVIPDIIRHISACIVRAEREVLLATNYIESSHAAALIAKSLRELDRRAGERGVKMLVKIIVDKGSPQQLIHQQVPFPVDQWKDVGLPLPEELPHSSIQVINNHRLPLGTFHSKSVGAFVIIDRRIGFVQSDNIQDRPNLEDAIHVEGPIVDSLYEAFILSWGSQVFDPPLITLNERPAAQQGPFKFAKEHEALQHIDQQREGSGLVDPADHKVDPTPVTASSDEHAYGQPDRKPHDPTAEGDDSAEVDKDDDEEVRRNVEGMDLNAKGMAGLSKHFDAGQDLKTKSTARDTQGAAAQFRPHVVHAPHDPVPMAMACRPPHSRPGHGSTSNPQDAVWTAAFEYAKKSIFIQSPTCQNKLFLEGVLLALRRGVVVTVWADLGFNDAGEDLPLQGGQNETALKHLIDELKKDGDEVRERLHWHWFTALDQDHPLSAKDKKRNCHIKFMAVDDEVIVVGNGNQDTQSWAHSQEINLMIDSKQITKEWLDALDRNQATRKLGAVDKDGTWRYSDGTPHEDLTGGDLSAFKRLGGVVGAVRRAQGKGGF